VAVRAITSCRPGGYKSSGLGKDLAREAYHANRRSKSVLIDL
jgi:aldehyde dehydrogenase (NAD+)